MLIEKPVSIVVTKHNVKRIDFMGNLIQNTCCLCGCMFEGLGNNPWPVSSNTGDRCCDLCNWSIVIPERIKLDNNNERGEQFGSK